ncbi:glycosyltransferase [Roseovarius sp. A46]|uniref:glycosyltransferase n=1 Tax=Roseovarius sp. A46 TaxID=2109331 RepID=UPI001F507EB3|nr:glycosyltransferase [Roseovarius sp. A46]
MPRLGPPETTREARAMRVIGLCRFSYPALGGFKRMHGSVAEREAYLYAPDRMALRFAHFESLTLPSIAAQSNGDFTFLVVTGESLPEPWRSRLHDLAADVPQMRIVEMEPMRHRDAMRRAIKQALGEDETESIQFRLDDDDAVSVGFVQSLRWFERNTRRMRRAWRNVAFEYNRGYAVRLSEQGIEAEAVQTHFWACGLAVLFRPGDAKTVMNYGHHKLHHEMPTLINPGPEMYLRALHDDNDTGEAQHPPALSPLDDARRALFRERFNVDEDRVKALFSARPAHAG